MPNKKNRRKIKQNELKTGLIKSMHNIFEQVDIICAICYVDINCKCKAEQYIFNKRRFCSTLKAGVFPRSFYGSEATSKNFHILLHHICSSVCNEQFEIIRKYNMIEAKKNNPDVDFSLFKK